MRVNIEKGENPDAPHREHPLGNREVVDAGVPADFGTERGEQRARGQDASEGEPGPAMRGGAGAEGLAQRLAQYHPVVTEARERRRARHTEERGERDRVEEVARGQRQHQGRDREQAVGELGEPGERARAFADVAQHAADPRAQLPGGEIERRDEEQRADGAARLRNVEAEVEAQHQARQLRRRAMQAVPEDDRRERDDHERDRSPGRSPFSRAHGAAGDREVAGRHANQPSADTAKITSAALDQP